MTFTAAAPPAYPPRTGWRRLRPRHWAILALMALGNYLCASLGYAFTIQPAGVAIVWPGSGFVLALLLLLKTRHWPAALAGAIAGNIAADLMHGSSLAMSLAGGLANGAEGVLAALVVRRLAGQAITCGTLREVTSLVLGAVVGSNAVTSLAGALVITHAGAQGFWRAWFSWWTGDGLGMLIVAPVILTLMDVARTRRRPNWRRVIEAVAVLGMIAFLTYRAHIGGLESPGVESSSPYLAFPLLLFAAVRYGPWGAAVASVVLAAATEWNAALAIGPFSEPRRFALRQVFETYTYLSLAGLSALVPAAILSERQRIEERLRDSEQRLREMAEHIREAFFVMDVGSGQPLYVSPTWADIWGRPMSDAYDPHVWFYAIHPDDRATMTESHVAVARGEASSVTVRVSRPDATTRWVRTRSFPVRDESGIVRRIVGVSEDITDLRHAEETYAEAQRMEAVGRLAGGVAHDFNNILTVVVGHADLLLADLAADDPRRADLETLLQAATSAAQLTRQLLLFSRKEVLQPETLRLGAAVANIGKMLKRLIGEHVELAIDATPDSGHIVADPGSIEQVVVNLAVNARDAMPQGGKLTIATRNADVTGEAAGGPRPGRYVVLTVRDTGIGMDDATKAHVFEPFFSTKPRGKGTGLGLATVHGVVSQAGGHIAVESAPGRGTTFTVWFPRADAPAAPQPAATPDQLPRGDETILVTEDEPAVRTLVARVLTALGYRVLQAPDGESALALAASHRDPIDLLLTDVVMPRMNGRALADKFVALHAESRVLFMSGYTDDDVLRHGVVSADMQLIEKPVTPLAIARKVRAVLDRR